MMCPEYYRGEVPRQFGPPVEMCKVNKEPLSQDMIDRMCRNNCNTCSLYRQSHHTTRMPQQSQDTGRGGGSAGVFVVIIIIVVIVTKFLRIW